MKITANLICLILAITLLTAIVTLAYIGMTASGTLYTNVFNRELTAEELARDVSVRDYGRSICIPVTAEDRETLQFGTDISVELTVVSVHFLMDERDALNLPTYELYTLIGEDRTGALWQVWIYRMHITEPNPIEAYTEGQRIIVYGNFWFPDPNDHNFWHLTFYLSPTVELEIGIGPFLHDIELVG